MAVICAISVHFSGILLLLTHIAYSFIKKDTLSDKKYLFVTILSTAALLILAWCHYYGIFDLLYKYKKRLFATHLHGNYQDFDRHNRIIDSNIDLNKLKKVFQDIQIKCPLSLEVIQPLNFNSNNELNEYVLKLKDDLKLLV